VEEAGKRLTAKWLEWARRSELMRRIGMVPTEHTDDTEGAEAERTEKSEWFTTKYTNYTKVGPPSSRSGLRFGVMYRRADSLVTSAATRA